MTDPPLLTRGPTRRSDDAIIGGMSTPRALRHAIAAVLVCLSAACRPEARDPARDEAAVLEAVRATCKAYLDGDPGRIGELLTEDFTLTDASGAVSTREDDLENARKGTIRYQVFENHDMKVRLHGDAAIVTGRTTVKGNAGSSAFAAEFQFTDTLVRRENRWRFAATHVSRVP